MKILHTSDWHLGQNFMGKSRLHEHQQFLQWLTKVVIEQHIDCLVIAGDIFDTGAPPSYARQCLFDFLSNLATNAGVTVVIVAGNHDSAAVLNESSALLKAVNVHVVGHIDAKALFATDAASHSTEHLTESLSEKNAWMASLPSWLIPVYSSTQQDAAKGTFPIGLVCALPFLRQRDLLSVSDSLADNEQALKQSIQAVYAHAFAYAEHIRQQLLNQRDVSLPIVMTGHLTTLGSELSESVRDVYIGNLDALPTDAFPPADYIALGHIHRQQFANKSRHIAYSGSPIALSFDELTRDKSVNLVTFTQNDAANDINVHVEQINLPTWQAMRHIQGDLPTVLQQVSDLCTQMCEEEQALWLQVDVVSAAYINDLQRQIQAVIVDAPIALLRVRRRAPEQQQRQFVATQQLDELSVDEVFKRRLALETTLDDDTSTQLTECFQYVVAQLTTPTDH